MQKLENYEDWINENIINYFLQFFVSKPFKVISTIFFAKKQKLWNSIFWKANLIFPKKINIRSPGDEPAMVLQCTVGY